MASPQTKEGRRSQPVATMPPCHPTLQIPACLELGRRCARHDVFYSYTRPLHSLFLTPFPYFPPARAAPVSRRVCYWHTLARHKLLLLTRCTYHSHHSMPPLPWRPSPAPNSLSAPPIHSYSRCFSRGYPGTSLS